MTIKTISPQDLYRHMELGHNVVLLDVRTSLAYEKGHILGAILSPLEAFNTEAFLHKIRVTYPTPPTIYVTCASGAQAAEACQYLATAGYEYLAVLEGGTRAWATAGLPIKRVKEGLFPFAVRTIPQQTHILVGSIVALGTIFGTFVNPGLLAIPLLAGVGVAYEGLAGTNYLKQALARMPWNT